MISALSYNRIEKEQDIIEEGCSKEVGRRTEEKLSFTKVVDAGEVLKTEEQVSLTDILYYEIQKKIDIENLKIVRKKEQKALLMILTSPEVSPIHYLKPGIAPDMLLLRPFDKTGFQKANGELFDAFMENFSKPHERETFVLNTRDGKTLIPYNKILYFEACNKKINVRAGSREYDFYGSIESLMETAPEYFSRSHRSYLVNTKKIRRIKVTDGLIELEKGFSVPLSRTYKPNFKKQLE